MTELVVNNRNRLVVANRNYPFDLNDRGLQYGDGFFTTMLIVDNSVANWSAHWGRLVFSAQQLKFEIEDELTIKKWLEETFETHIEAFNSAKLIITRGQGGRGYQPIENPKANYYLYLNQVDFSAKITRGGEKNRDEFANNELGLKLSISEVRWGKQPLLAGVKHLNRLENVMAQRALIGAEYDEALMLDIDDKLISATSASLCLIKGEQVVSPQIVTAGIHSTSLELLAKILQHQGLSLVYQELTLADLKSSDEVFLSNAVRGIMPVKEIAGIKFKTDRSVGLAENFLQYQDELLK
jgi:4-amino-4-deoxychorismate lyase